MAGTVSAPAAVAIMERSFDVQPAGAAGYDAGTGGAEADGAVTTKPRSTHEGPRRIYTGGRFSYLVAGFMKFSELMERVRGRGLVVEEVRLGAGKPVPTPWSDGSGGSDPEITRVCDDSRKVKAGDLFVARGGTKDDGAKYIVDAMTRGAGAIVAEKVLDILGGWGRQRWRMRIWRVRYWRMRWWGGRQRG